MSPVKKEKKTFSHENLHVYQRSLQFVAWIDSYLETIPSKWSVKDQIDRASTSVPLNIAEGNVKASLKDRARYWQIAYGSCVECAACLDVLVIKSFLTQEQAKEGKALLIEISSMLARLLQNIGTQISEDEPIYKIEDKDEDEDEDSVALSL